MPPAHGKDFADVSKVLDLPETRDFFEANSLTRVDLPPRQFGELIQSDLKHWTTIINTVGVKTE